MVRIIERYWVMLEIFRVGLTHLGYCCLAGLLLLNTQLFKKTKCKIKKAELGVPHSEIQVKLDPQLN